MNDSLDKLAVTFPETEYIWLVMNRVNTKLIMDLLFSYDDRFVIVNDGDFFIIILVDNGGEQLTRIRQQIRNIKIYRKRIPEL